MSALLRVLASTVEFPERLLVVLLPLGLRGLFQGCEGFSCG